VEFPQVFIIEAHVDEAAAAKELAEQLEGLGIDQPFVLSGTHGKGLIARIEGDIQPESPAGNADKSWASELGSRAHRSGADAIVAVGGGRCLDIGKLAAARAGLTLVAVPTQLSHDGLCSPVAVVPNEAGRTESLAAIAPRALFISLPTIGSAPAPTVAAGLGDLIANPLALRDWALAAEHGLSEVDQRSWDLSVESFEAIEPFLDQAATFSANDHAFLRRLADALVLSGMAMIHAGTSRPASGAEHEISHAIDQRFGGRALHGAQVAFGSIVSVALYGDDVDAFRSRLRTIGLPDEPAALGLDDDDVVSILMAAPDTRPGRFTILEDADLDEGGARALVRRIWSS
jgi:glycerol-1-phosphate dehydrogenase [NAD(P)+]